MTSVKQICEFEFSISGMLRFVSHLELQNFWARLLVRAEIPVKFSEGFNPHPRLSLPLPRSVGIGTIHDRGRIEVGEDFDPETMLEKLRPLVPFEMELNRVWVSPANRLERVEAVEYEINLTGFPTTNVAAQIEEILRGPCLVTRRSKRSNQDVTVDLRPWILELTLREERVRAKVAYTPGGSVRPAELLGLLHLPPVEFMGKMTRVETYWSQTPSVT
jgi:radical SAM-linked protein